MAWSGSPTGACEPRWLPYSANQTSYDLTRLRRKGLIQRLPGRNPYALTPDGTRFALFSSKVHDRLLVPLLAVIDHSIKDYLRSARLAAA